MHCIWLAEAFFSRARLTAFVAQIFLLVLCVRRDSCGAFALFGVAGFAFCLIFGFDLTYLNWLRFKTAILIFCIKAARSARFQTKDATMMDKRNFFKNLGLISAAGATAGLAASASAAPKNSPLAGRAVFNVLDFGAKGDGKTSDTAAIQKALDAAGEAKGTAYFPSGAYLCSGLKARANSALAAEPQWGCRGVAGAVLRLENPSADSLLDITGAFGVRVYGLCFQGAASGSASAIFLNNASGLGSQEDCASVENCKITGFRGDAVRLLNARLFALRGNLFAGNAGAGAALAGRGGLVSGNRFSANAGGGFVCRDSGSEVVFSLNRVDSNGRYGLEVADGCDWNITGNSFNRNLGPGLSMRAVSNSAVVSNVFRANGRTDSKDRPQEASCHALMTGCRGVAFASNSAMAGRGASGKGPYSPLFGIVARDCSFCALTSNAFFNGFTAEMLRNIGGCDREFSVSGNVQCPLAL